MQTIEICHRCPERQRPCAGKCECKADPQKRDIVELSGIAYCPLGKFSWLSRLRAIFNRKTRRTPADHWKERGPLLWAELHRWALTGDIDRPLLWLGKFTERLGCGNCGNHWKAWLLANPPNVESREALFRWTWRAHEGVNQRLGKPGMSLEAALTRWTTSPIQ